MAAANAVRRLLPGQGARLLRGRGHRPHHQPGRTQPADREPGGDRRRHVRPLGRHRQRVRGARQGPAHRMRRHRAPGDAVRVRRARGRPGEDAAGFPRQDRHRLVHRRQLRAAGDAGPGGGQAVGVHAAAAAGQHDAVRRRPGRCGDRHRLQRILHAADPNGRRQAAPLRPGGLRHHLPAGHADRQRGDDPGQAGAGTGLPARLHPRLARGAAGPEGRRGRGDGDRPRPWTARPRNTCWPRPAS